MILSYCQLLLPRQVNLWCRTTFHDKTFSSDTTRFCLKFTRYYFHNCYCNYFPHKTIDTHFLFSGPMKKHYVQFLKLLENGIPVSHFDISNCHIFTIIVAVIFLTNNCLKKSQSFQCTAATKSSVENMCQVCYNLANDHAKNKNKLLSYIGNSLDQGFSTWGVPRGCCPVGTGGLAVTIVKCSNFANLCGP